LIWPQLVVTARSAVVESSLEAGVDVRFADLPQIERATGRFLLQQMVVVAELEPLAAHLEAKLSCGRPVRCGKLPFLKPLLRQFVAEIAPRLVA
jgi:hypothetical protein